MWQSAVAMPAAEAPREESHDDREEEAEAEAEAGGL